MRVKTTIILVVLAVVTQFTVERLVAHKLSSHEFDDLVIRELVSSIEQLEIKRSDLHVLFEQEDGEWRIKEPIDFLAQRGTVDLLLRDLRNFRPLGEGDEDKMAEYGLDKPTAEVWLRVPSFSGARKVYHFAFGNVSARPEYFYVALDGRPFLCRADLREMIQTVTFEEMRSKTLSGIAVEECSGLVLRRGEQSVAIERRDERWVLVGDSVLDANQSHVETVIAALNNWQIREYVDDAASDRSRYGLASPRIIVEVREWDGRDDVVLEVGSAAEDGPGGSARVYVAQQGQPYVFVAEAEPLELLSSATDRFRNRQLIRISDPNVARIEIETPDTSAVLDAERGVAGITVGRSWYPVAMGTLERFIDRLREDSITDFLPEDRNNLQTYGLDPTQAITITLTPQDGDRETVIIGNKLPGSEERYVYNPRWDFFAVASIKGSEFLGAPYSLRSERVLQLRADQFRQIDVRTGNRIELPEPVHEVFQRPYQKWRMKGLNNKQLENPEAIELLVEGLRTLTALEWQAGGVGSPGPESCWLEISVESLAEQEDPFEDRTLYVGPRDNFGERWIRDGVGGWVFRVRYPRQADPFEIIGQFLRKL